MISSVKSPITGENTELSHRIVHSVHKGKNLVYTHKFYVDANGEEFTTTALDEENLTRFYEGYKYTLQVEQRKEEFKQQYKDVPRDFKVEAIRLMEKDWGFVDNSMSFDELYDNAVYHLFNSSTRRIKNLAKKLRYEEIPCETCRNIIKFWKVNNDYMWSKDKEHLFKD